MAHVSKRAVAALSLVGALAMGCAGTTNTPDTPTEPVTEAASPAERLAATSQATQDAGSARVTFTQTIDIKGLPGSPVKQVGEGIMSFADKRGSMTVDLGPAGGGVMEARLDGTTFYMKVPAPQRRQLRVETPWIKLDLKDLPGGESAGQLRQQFATDPSANLAYLKALSDVEEVGTVTIRGETTTHYRGTLDVDAARKELTVEEFDGAAPFDQLGVDEVPTELWLDADNRLRRIQTIVDVSQAEGARRAEGSITQEFEFYDYGVDVNVEFPSPSEVTDAKDVPALSGG